MPHGDKSKYTNKRKRHAKHIEKADEQRGLSTAEAERRAWATVNRFHHGGGKPDGGYGLPEDYGPLRKSGRYDRER